MSSQMAQLQEATIKAQCKTLRIPMIASQFGTLAEQAIREKKSHIGYLEALLLAEIEERERDTIERRIREAHLPRLQTLEEFDYAQSPNVTAAKMRDLAEGGYIVNLRRTHLEVDPWSGGDGRHGQAYRSPIRDEAGGGGIPFKR